MAVIKTKMPKITLSRKQTISNLQKQVRSETAHIAKRDKRFQTKFLSADEAIAFVKSKFPTARVPKEIRGLFEAGGSTQTVGNFENIRSVVTSNIQSAETTARKLNAEDKAFLKGKDPKKFLGIPVITIALPDNSGIVSLYRTGPNSKILNAVADRYSTRKDIFVSLKKMRSFIKRFTNK